MKKLEDIPKQNIFEVPDGYFDKLPSVIQARIAKPEPKFWQLPAFRYAMPLLIAKGFLIPANPPLRNPKRKFLGGL